MVKDAMKYHPDLSNVIIVYKICKEKKQRQSMDELADMPFRTTNRGDKALYKRPEVGRALRGAFIETARESGTTPNAREGGAQRVSRCYVMLHFIV